MKHLVKPECRFKCTFIQITDELWLCPHASYGAVSYRKGAVEEARTLLAKAGGYEAVLRKLEKEAAARESKARNEQRKAATHELARPALRYD